MNRLRCTLAFPSLLTLVISCADGGQMPGEDHKPAGDLAALGSASSAASTGVFSAVLDRQRTWSSIDGVWLTAYYPQCPNAAVRVDLWSNYGGSVGWQIDDRCFTYNASPNDPTSGNAYANQSFCLFRSPRPVGFPGTSQLLRLWSIKSDCKTYADDAGAMRFSDYNPGAVADTHTYRALVDNERVVVTKASYQIVFDRRTGVPYEYYNLRSGQRPLRNTLHANAGSAAQFSLSDFSRVMDSPCRGTYPWWNPVQAGSYCGCNAGYCNYPHNRPPATAAVLCDGVANPACTSARNNFHAGEFRVLNWAYGHGDGDGSHGNYYGAYNAQDTVFLRSGNNFHDHYAELNVHFRNVGPARSGVLYEAPAVFLNHGYRDFWYDKNADGNITHTYIPENRSGSAPDWGIDGSGYAATLGEIKGQWITFKNFFFPVKSDYVTLGWFLDANALANFSYAPGLTQVLEAPMIKTPVVKVIGGLGELPTGVVMGLRWVIFPYRYDEVVTTGFGTQSVKDTIAAMRAHYHGSAAW
jgi:hypothetical protein